MTSWVEACAADDIEQEDLINFKHGGQDYAIYRSPDDKYYATAGHCTSSPTTGADGGNGAVSPI